MEYKVNKKMKSSRLYIDGEFIIEGDSTTPISVDECELAREDTVIDVLSSQTEESKK